MALSTPRPISDPKYYLREQSLVPMLWKGNGSKILGIHGQEVDEQTYLNLHDGYFNGIRLPRYIHPERRGSFEVTVTLPKSPSIMGEVAGDTRIVGVLEDSMRAAEKEIERQAYTRCPWERNNNLIMTDVIHPSSRAGDPHLHGHIIFENMALASKGWKAIELKYVEWERVGEAVRDTQIKGFRELSYKVRREGSEYEIVGVPAEVKARFSRRHDDIKELEAGYERLKGSPLTSKAKGKLSLYERPEKEDRPVDERREDWRGQLTDSEHSLLKGIVARARATVKMEQRREEMRQAFDRWRPVEQVPEIQRGYGRSR